MPLSKRPRKFDMGGVATELAQLREVHKVATEFFRFIERGGYKRLVGEPHYLELLLEMAQIAHGKIKEVTRK